MSNDTAKTIATCAVWLAVACILTFGGLFRMNIQGGFLAFSILFGVSAVLAVAAAGATFAIWRSGRQGKEGLSGSASTAIYERRQD